MKFRRLQRLTETEQWEDHGYAYEREDGQVSFRYNNLVWGQIGARYNKQLKQAHASLEEVPQVIPATQHLRWLEIEVIDGEPEAIKVQLDKECKMPWLKPVPIKKPVVA